VLVVVGRDVVLAACEAALADALAGRGRLVLLDGEAGIGKTTVARAVAERAWDAGATVRWGASWEDDPLPFGVWSACLRHPEGDACAAAAARLERGEGEDVPDPTNAGRARTRFFAEVVDALRDASSARPQLLVLEDLHWSDIGSLELLQAVAAHLPTMRVLALATFRPDELPAEARLRRIGGAAERVSLEGLAEADVGHLLDEILGRAPSPEEVRAVHERTAGNPLFVTQVGRLLAAGSSIAVPSGVREILSRRLAHLSSACERLLGVASVLGTDMETDLLAEVAGIPEPAVLEHLDKAATARLVTPVGPGGRCAFVHELVRAACYDSIGSAERTALHRRAIDALESRRAPASVLAHHAERARFDPADPRPARFALAAGREALARFAWGHAAAQCRNALAAAPPGEAGDEVRAEAWLALGDALLRSGDDTGATDAFLAAAAIGRERGHPELVARAALGFGAGLGSFEVRLRDDLQLDLLEEAVAVLPATSPLRPHVLARLSVALSFVGSQQRRIELADEAIELARRRGDDAALAAALAARCDVVAGPAHVAERLDAAGQIVALARRARDPHLELLGRRLRVVALLEQRDLAAFGAEVSAYARTAERLADPLYSFYVPLWRAMRAHADGRLAEAERLAREAREVGVSGGSSNAGLLQLVFALFVALDRRDENAIARVPTALLAEHPDLLGQEAATDALFAVLAARTGRVEQTRAILARAGADVLDRATDDQEWLAAMAQFLVAAVAAGDEPLVRRTYELLLPYAGLGVFEGLAVVDHAVVDRFLALAAGHLGDTEAARHHAEAALVANADAGRLVLAPPRAAAARALRAAGGPDAEWGRELGRAAVEDYEALGLDALADELRPLAAARQAPAASADSRARPATTDCALVREGDTWAITFEGLTVRARHTKGVADLAVLLAQPGREVHVRTLSGVDDLALPSSHQAALDGTALEQYRRRLAELDADLATAQDHHDVGMVERLTVERDALLDQLSAAFGLGGRSRPAPGDPDERLRKAVSARVKASIAKVEGLHPALGRHLRNSVRTGYWCAYVPERPMSWRISTARQR
jgi:tetratricopeptide (TPR) repeat protein